MEKISIDDILEEVETLKSNKWCTNKRTLPEGADKVIYECFKDIGKPGARWVSYKEAVALLKKHFDFSVSTSTLQRIWREEVKPKFEGTNGKAD